MRTVWVQRVSKAMFICTSRWKHAVHSLPAFKIRTQNLFFYFSYGWTVRRLCVTIGQTSVNENTTNLERELYLCLTLDWHWSDVLLASTFTRGKKRSHF